jgi:hypothetical protein
MSRGLEDRLRQKFDEKMRRAAEKAKAERAAKQTTPARTSQPAEPVGNDTAEKK